VYEISDNANLYLARITEARKSVVRFEVIEQLVLAEQPGKLILVAALFKFDRFEWMVEKATELGVDEIAPFEATRTEHGLMQASVKRRARWERIALEASQQSRRAKIPRVSETVNFASALSTPAEIRLFLDEDTKAPAILTALAAPPETISLLLGPEGGWTDAERQLAIEKGWVACSLGGTILRSETAAIAGLAVLQARRASATLGSGQKTV
jgi:16S rRNA (uracil1498-N3)-methyltransferase